DMILGKPFKIIVGKVTEQFLAIETTFHTDFILIYLPGDSRFLQPFRICFPIRPPVEIDIGVANQRLGTRLWHAGAGPKKVTVCRCPCDRGTKMLVAYSEGVRQRIVKGNV